MYKLNKNYLLLNDGERKEMRNEEGDNYQLYCLNIGEIDLPTGQIVACDPFIEIERDSFLKEVKPGKYPVLINVADLGNNHERVAYAMIKFSQKEVVTWELAIIHESMIQELDELSDEEFFGYGVDAGTGSFMDKQTALSIIAYEKERQEDDSYFYLDFEDEFSKNNWFITSIKGKTDNFAVFTSGWGDGYYPTFWGLDENGEPVCLVTKNNI